MNGLFATKPDRPAGYGNGRFLGDLGNGVPDEVMRADYLAGEYPDLNRAYIAFWRKMVGRSTSGGK